MELATAHGSLSSHPRRRLPPQDRAVLARQPLRALRPPAALSSAHVRHRLLARLLAAAARLSADPAVLVLPSVALTLLTAHLAGGRADLKHLAQDLLIGAGPPRRQGAGGSTYIRTVEVEPDALLQLLDHLLGEAGIGAGGTGLRAGLTFIDAADKASLMLPCTSGCVLMMARACMGTSFRRKVWWLRAQNAQQ
jgi:hypothetical protein